MKVVSTEALTKLIQLVKSAFVKVEDVVETSEVTLADVATSGDYDDLINKPSAVTESTVSGWGFTKNTGTVTSVNNVSPVNGNVTLSIPTVPTNISAFTNDSGYITSSALSGYATENYVDSGLSSKQATLVSGTNIKTINNTSLLGSGNIDIQGGSSYSAGDWIDISNDTISAKGDASTDLIGETLYGWNYAGAGAEILDRNLIYTKSMSTGVYLKIYDASGNEITQIGVMEGAAEDYTYYTVTGLYLNSEWQAELYLEGRQSNPQFNRNSAADVSRSLDEVLPTQKAVKTYADNLVTNMQTTSNLVTSVSSSSTNTQYPSAKCVYDIVDLKADKSDLNGKADTNFSNVTQVAKNSAMLWGLPNLNSGISIAYNAAVPSNGYILFTGGEVTNNYMRGFINDVQVVQLGSSSYQNMERSGLIPVCQGDIISFENATALFYPMKGTI